MRLLFVCLLMTASFTANAQPAASAVSADSVRYAKEGKFEDVRDDLKQAIQARGLVIDLTSHIGGMLDRTGKDLGQTAKLFRNAESFAFCSAKLSRLAMQADPHNIAFCPYSVIVYTTEGEPGKVYVAYRRFPSVGSPRVDDRAESAQ